jgi:DNA-binding LacI/PurR family transcriptional regulator/signal transduction histidine kinase
MLIALLSPTYSEEIFQQFYYGVRSGQELLHARGLEAEICVLDNNSLPLKINYLGSEAELLRIAAKDQFSGVIVLGGVLAYLDDGTLPVFLRDTFHDKPIINVMSRLEGIPSIRIDNARGINSLVDHLVEVHGYGRIGIIDGLEGHPDTEARHEAFLKRMAYHDLAVDPAWIFQGMYSASSGHRVAEEWLHRHSQGNDVPDALVAANDDMAYGFIHGFNETAARDGLTVERPAVCGFDNRDIYTTSSPSITTVNQPIYLMARSAMVHLVEHITDGSELPEDVLVSPELIVRRSCGCSGLPAGAEQKANGKAQTGRFAELIANTTDTIRRYLQTPDGPISAEALHAHLESVLNEVEFSMGLDSLNTLIREAVHRTEIEHSRTKADPDPAIHQVLGELTGVVEQGIRQKLICLRERSSRLRRFQGRMLSAEDEAAIVEALRLAAPSLGIREAYLILDSRLCPACPADKLTVLGTDGKTTQVDRDELADPNLLVGTPGTTRVVMGLQTFRDGFGYMACDVEDPSLLETRDIARTVGSRVRELHRTKELLEAERYAGLGSLLSGFAHHVNTPLGISVTAMSVIRNELNALTSIERRLSRSDLGRVSAAAAMMDRNISAIRRMVELFERLSVSSEYHNWSFGDADALVASIVEAKRVVVERRGVSLIADYSAGGERVVFPTESIRFVLHELIDNSLKHAFPEGSSPSPPTLSVRVSRSRERFIVDYADNGVGIPPDQRDELFAPFSRRGSREKGLGIGLFAVKRVVQDLLKGEVRLADVGTPGFRIALGFPLSQRRPEAFHLR